MPLGMTHTQSSMRLDAAGRQVHSTLRVSVAMGIVIGSTAHVYHSANVGRGYGAGAPRVMPPPHALQMSLPLSLGAQRLPGAFTLQAQARALGLGSGPAPGSMGVPGRLHRPLQMPLPQMPPFARQRSWYL